jgi:hypothetical protein
MIGKLARGGLAGVFLRWAAGLRFPFVFALMAIMFIVNLLIPDMIPFVDEIVMGLVAILLASLKKKPVAAKGTESQAE